MNKLIYKIEKRIDQIIILSDIFKNKLDWNIIFSFPKNDEFHKNSLGSCYDDFFYSNSTIISDPVYFFHYRWKDNYEHWIRDTIFMLFGYYEMLKTIPNLKLTFFNGNIQAYHREVLELLFNKKIEDFIINVHLLNHCYIFKELYFPYVDYRESFLYKHKPDIPFELEFIINKLKQKAEPFSKNNYPERVYLSRRNLNSKTHWHNRTLLNEDEIVDLLTKYGYQEVFSDELSLVDEINIFSNVKKVVTPIGSGCANILFSKDSRWFILVNEYYRSNTISLVESYDKRIIYFPKTKVIKQEGDDTKSGFITNLPYICDINKLYEDLKKFEFL